MADPASGATSTDSNLGANAITLPSSVTQTPGAISGTSGSSGTDNSWLTSLGNFATAAIPVGASLYQAGRATTNAQNLTNAISATTQPANQLGTATTNQLLGGPAAGGQTGTTVAGVGGVNQTLLQTAGQYASGNLTPAQQAQVDQYVKGQKAQAAASLGGNINSSAGLVANQQIDNNAAMLAQNLVQGNVNLSTSALGAVTQAYNSLVTNALNASGLGLKGTATAVQTQLANDSQVSQLLQQIMGGIASTYTTAQGGAVGQQGGNKQTTPGGQLGAAAGTLLQKLGIGGGGNQTPTLQNANNVFIADPAQKQASDVQISDVTAPTPSTPDTTGFTPMASATDWLSYTGDQSGSLATWGTGSQGPSY